MTYIMDSPTEGKRLEEKTDAERVERELRWMGIAPGLDVLEVGCGTGAVTRAAARLATLGRVVGVDASASRLEQAQAFAATEQLACTFTQAQATALPFAANFDLTYARMLFEYLEEPQQALQQMIKATRPGGTVAVADLDSQILS
ncbi:class I SAM-dependent methyltransferase, partial [Armatimonas sp.]|uniref:class I SAM-dependent methyltransferase n=1 Tax=Armatimonas sp. TaxID=1872638 RepID=UPI00286BEB30